MAKHFSVRPLSVGAEIFDIKGDPADPAVRDELYATWLEYGLFLFRNITSIEQHLELSRCFGELELHPLVHMRAPEHELFMTVGGEAGPPWVYDESQIKRGTIPWHRDTAYTPGIAKGAMLRILETPKVGGETCFADTARAYDDLPDELKTRLAGLEYVAVLKQTPMEQSGPGAIWKSVRPLNDEEWARVGLNRADYENRRPGELPPVVHPAVIVHPESGRTCLFLSPKEFDFFVGMERAESDQLFKQLCDHMLQDKYVYKHHWQVNDVMGWDNRRFMHAAIGNHVGDHRRGLRTTLAGELTVGRLYEPATA